MIDDPAWFYSSTAQASAAIVGLIGGFLVSRLIDHGAGVREERRHLAQRVAPFAAEIRDRRLLFENGVQQVEAEIRTVAESQARGNTGVLVTPWQFAPGPGNVQNVAPAEFLPVATARLERLKLARDAYPPLTGVVRLARISQYSM